MIDAARERLAPYRHVRAQVADVHELPFRASSFDPSSSFTRSRTPSTRSARSRSARASLRPGGRLVLLCLDEHEQRGRHGPLRRAPPGLLAHELCARCSRAPGSTSSRATSPAAKPRSRTSRSCSRSPKSRAGSSKNAQADSYHDRPRSSSAREAPPKPHRHHRRRDGHDHPHLRDEGGRHPRRALRRREEGSAQQRRPLLAHAAEDDLRHPPALPRGRRRHHRDQHVRRDQHRAERVLRRRSARARRAQGPGVLPEDHRRPVPQRPRLGDQRAVGAAVPRVGRPRRQRRRASSASSPARSGRSPCRSRTRPTPTTRASAS